MIKIIRPDDEFNYPKNATLGDNVIKIFLAGTIDNGESDNWQDELISELAFYNMDPDSEEDFGYDYSLGVDKYKDIIIYNPRRENWNKNATEKDVEEQIRWEQEKLDDSDLIIMYLADNSKSPISLLELGLYGPQGKMIVFCTYKFYRYNNVKLICEKYFIPLVNSLDNRKICDEISNILNEI